MLPQHIRPRSSNENKQPDFGGDEDLLSQVLRTSWIACPSTTSSRSPVWDLLLARPGLLAFCFEDLMGLSPDLGPIHGALRLALLQEPSPSTVTQRTLILNRPRARLQLLQQSFSSIQILSCGLSSVLPALVREPNPLKTVLYHHRSTAFM